MTEPMSPERLAEIRTRAAHLSEYPAPEGEADQLAGVDVPALLAEVDRLRAELDHTVTVVSHAIWDKIGLRHRDEADHLAEQLVRVRDLFAGGPDTPCRTTWRHEPAPGVVAAPPVCVPVECVEVPMADIRAALGGAP